MVSIALKKIQIILLSTLVPLGLLYTFFHLDEFPGREIFVPDVPVVQIDDVSFVVEIADSSERRQMGLSNRKALDTAEGLLFIFPESEQHAMWMKDMNFPIDIIWIDEELTIIEVQKNITPDTWPQKFRPYRPAKYAIETNIHFSDTFGFKSGMKVTLPEEVVE